MTFSLREPTLGQLPDPVFNFILAPKSESS